MATKEVSLKSKINEIRLLLSTEMAKSGKNTYSKYDYFQLKDFMPRALALFNEKGVYTKFWVGLKKIELPAEKITKTVFDENGVKTGEAVTEKENFEYKEYAFLEVTNLDNEEEVERYEKETANCLLSGAQPIQNLGGKSTYMKRYMYMDLLEISENDKVEEETGKPVKVETKTATKKAPVTKKVETKPVSEVKPADFEPKKAEQEVTPVAEVVTDGLMSMSHKVELANYIKEKGMDPRNTIVEIAKELNTDVPQLKESDYEKIKAMIDEREGK